MEGPMTSKKQKNALGAIQTTIGRLKDVCSEAESTLSAGAAGDIRINYTMAMRCLQDAQARLIEMGEARDV